MVKEIIINPDQLIFREHNQNNTESVREIISDCPPITAYYNDEDGNYGNNNANAAEITIIDGHNRAKVALEIGLKEITVRAIKKSTFDKLIGMEYTIQAISIAIHLFFNDYDAANWINLESGGVSQYEKADEILDIIW